MTQHPSTIRSPESFDNSQWSTTCPHCGGKIGFDGIFNWEWTQGCFSGKITPMDFDGVVERKGHYLIFETKDPGTNIPHGQEITLNMLRTAKTFTIMKIWGKEVPEKMDVIYPDGQQVNNISTIEEMKGYVSRWYNWANS